MPRIYEYFLTQFANKKAHDDGEFFTPISLVSLMAHVIDPEGGTVLDPACGSGGMFVQSARIVEEHGESPTEKLTFRGLEKNPTTIRLAKMNLAVHGLEGDIEKAITYYEDPHELLGKADVVMANPPFNVDEIDADKIKADPRLPFGLPGVNKKGKVSNGNYIWISYFYSYLNDTGRAGFVMSSQASSAGGEEAKVRQKLVETGAVDVMVAIRSNFFYTRSVPCELWFLNRNKSDAHRDKVLMLDARNVYRKVTPCGSNACVKTPTEDKRDCGQYGWRIVNASTPHRLITLAFSHYNEKARWALDRYAIPYSEEPHMPFVCSLAVAVATRGRGGVADPTSSRYSTPVLILNDGRVLSDSTDIVRFASAGDDSLFPSNEVSELVDHYGDQLGPYTRLLAYWYLGRHPGMIERLAADSVSSGQAKVFQRLAPLMQSQLNRALGLTEAGRDSAMTRLREELDATASRLGGRDYLCGDRFTAADLTFAALLAPGLCITQEEGFGAILPEIASLDDEAQALISEVRDHPAGQFALRIYGEERRRSIRDLG